MRPTQRQTEQVCEYPTEQGNEDGHVFSSPSEHQPVEPAEQPVRETRPNTPEQNVSPENDRLNGDAPGSASAHEPALVEEPIADIVNRVVIYDDKPMENLPSLSPPELKIIGRCVTFNGTFKIDGDERKMYYEGLVATISRDTLMLMHVHRYTEEDFAQYRNDYGKDNSESFQPPKQHGVAAVTEMPGENAEKTLANMGGADSNEMGGMNEMAGSAADEPDQGDHGEVTTRVRNKLKGQAGTLGPIPFMTFSRSRIHNVEFGRDPRSNFYSLFQDPSRALMDMQYLRMFCRRYIVHTSQGNNPRQVPLRAFVTVRCACPDLDNDLLLSVTREELAHLIKAERAIRRGKRSKERQRRALITTYRAPPGLFRDTGLMYLTKIPQTTLIVGAITFIAVAAFIVYAAISITMSEPYVVAKYMSEFTSYIIASCVVWAVSVVVTIYHAVRLQLPVQQQRRGLLVRVVLLLGSIACGLMTIIVMSRSFTTTESRRFLIKNRQILSLSYYYLENSCSGFTESCVDCSGCIDAPLCGIPNDQFSTPCHKRMRSQFERSCMPLVIFACIVTILSLVQMYLVYKFVAVGHLIERRLASAGERADE